MYKATEHCTGVTSEAMFFHRQFCWWWNVLLGMVVFLPQIHCLGFSLPCGLAENIQIAGPRLPCKNCNETEKSLHI